MPTDRSGAVQIRGLAEFQRELKKINLATDLRDANKNAAQLVADAANARRSAVGGVATKTTVKAAAEQRRAKVTIGSNSEPWALGAEFGGQGRPTTMQFKRHLGRTGYFLWPAVRETREEFIDAYDKALQQLMRRAFPD